MKLITMLVTICIALFGIPLAAQDTSTTLEVLVPEVINTYPHDATAYTQGLVLHEGFFYESTGLYGFSTLRKVDIQTGEVLMDIELPDYLFAEGLALVDGRLVQITWREGVALTYDLAAFSEDTIVDVGIFLYQTEGWGLCYDGEALYMSDGTDILYRRDPQTFEIIDQVNVVMDGQPLTQLNELECVGDSVYANVWQTDLIVRIDKTTGTVTGRIDTTGLLTPEDAALVGQPPDTIRTLIYNNETQTFTVQRESRNSGGVLNGIAYNPESDTFYITGKLWPKMFEVRFVAP